ncbi:MAG TPA: acylphosphatase [Bacteroides sp.]|nr:acylphosphatase [Bacteroides sp.]
MKRHFQIRVFGRVQGVGFRYAATKKARSLHLKGWVENLPDGSVGTAVEGAEKNCWEYINWCRKGPGYSWVEKIEFDEKDPVGYDEFRVKY